MSKLLIVESPAKAKTIKKYLGKGYEVMASMGHVRDLPAKKLSVDVNHGFKPEYTILEGKEDVVKKLEAKASKCDKIYLATDPDREGEAISWHLAHILNLDLKDKNRVAFNEITKNGVNKGMENPKEIDLNLVNAQQARRILDRIVGYKLSPVLWTTIRKGLSAGRVQSVAVKLVVDREAEISNFVPEESWTIDAIFETEDRKSNFKASFYGDKKGKINLLTEDQTKKISEQLKGADFKVLKVTHSKRKKSPVPPFITSTLQQEASSKLSMRPKQTMMIAQQLYEGVEMQGMGAVGLITYMRTDSLRVSEDAVNEAREYINGRWSDKYLPEKPRFYKIKKGAQDAHEAIRPTMPNLDPDKAKASLNKDQYRLYKLVWDRFMASQMKDSIEDTVKCEIEANNNFIFKGSGYKVAFDGFTVLYQIEKDEEAGKDMALFGLKKDDAVYEKEILENQHFTQPPARYTEASLIKIMEKNGIGRPSTYATVITTIISREYVVREKKNLIPTELGTVTTKLMEEQFPNIVDTQFTANMEEDLDIVEEGKIDYVKLLEDFYKDFEKTLKGAKKSLKDVKIQLESDKTDIVCEKCGKPMVIKQGRFGKFIGCTGYPECKNIKKMTKDGEVMEKEESEEQIDIICEKCGKPMEVKQGRFGKFIGCTGYPECKNIKNFGKDGKVLTEEEQKEEQKTDLICEKCGRPMVKKMGRFGEFIACSGYPDCKNIKSITKETGAKCPLCDGNIVEKRNKRGKIFYSCDNYPKCDFVSGDEPVKDKCPNCGKTLFLKKGKNSKVYCKDESCGYEVKVEEK